MVSPFRRWPLTTGLVLMLVAAGIILGFSIWGLEPVLDLLLGIDTLIQAHYWQALSIYVLAFIVLATLAVPVGSLFCLAAGYLFGIGVGALAALLSSLVAAGLSFLMVRHFSNQGLRDRLESGRLAGLLAIMERDANWYLVLLRIVPIAPFFLINAAAAITRISARRYHLATLGGLIPTTVIYASLGSGIGSLLEAHELAGPEILLRPEIGVPLLALTALIVVSYLVKRRLTRRLRARTQSSEGLPSRRNTT
ncbi:TVP38/TMEM64 family protein [Wenzhouxiangella marina]|uniref:TVP38/TMEM64 family protein n=1 Tax=Wenzhouxiangella marina TaxID=1579979 RepID=UPI000673967B|nr:VTT domain-containing protein [Wenzhouxiangella marina]MBB6085728.1 putative membrane protein YdjX (TVP38/TMEM64 family) [Wenzhouxiangella marina]